MTRYRLKRLAVIYDRELCVAFNTIALCYAVMPFVVMWIFTRDVNSHSIWDMPWWVAYSFAVFIIVGLVTFVLCDYVRYYNRIRPRKCSADEVRANMPYSTDANPYRSPSAF